MIHYVHVVHIDSERAAATGKALCLMLAAWLAWHFLPDAPAFLNGWLGGWPATVWNAVTLPFVWAGYILRAVGSVCSWVAGAVDGSFRVAATVQAVLLPVWALFAGRAVGRCIDREHVRDGAVVWLTAACLNALCGVLLGYPMLACMVVAGSLAAFVATTLIDTSPHDLLGWLAAALAAGLSAWGMARYGAALQPVCWLLVPLSWCCLPLGAACAIWRDARGRGRNHGPVRLVLLAAAMVMVAVSPLAAEATRAAVLLTGGMQPAPAQPALSVLTATPLGHDVADGTFPAQAPVPAALQHRNGQRAKPPGATQSKRPRA